MDSRITMKVEKRQVVTLSQGQSKVELRTPSKQKFNVSTLGKQGPVGSVAAEVLVIAANAHTMAEEALIQTAILEQEQAEMVSGMSMTINHYIGVIGAQES
ncbi:hypothetical protein SAMN04488136_1646 [Vibrio xiamenensis]|uniref:Uncharacterized protein n=1 Tax=Vibrio xiamenensis TaxID=861298 RepID=A0A1G8HUM8_9VIBR|nr:hypothetical protein [Vibrio xiamenensis]SDI10252.1 hypothetical protein SAMN04488136_1646 [Vibrio xiamenensis]